MENTPPTQRRFPNEYVDVKFSLREPPIDVINLGIPRDIDMNPTVYFSAFRKVINLAVVEFNNPGVQLASFPPPIEIRVHYNEQDVAIAKGYQNLKLGFWNGVKWTLFTVEKHNFHLEPNGSVPLNVEGWGVVFIQNWADPTISWGT